MKYEDIVEAQRQRDMKEASADKLPGRGRGLWRVMGTFFQKTFFSTAFTHRSRL